MNSPMARPSKAASSIPDPPGFSSSRGGKQVSSATELSRCRADHIRLQREKQQQQPATRPEETDALKMKKAWEIAIAPSKQLPMNGIMMYMSGNSLQIFSIMMVFMLFKGPIQGLINTNAAFAKYETPTTRGRLVAVKAVYVLMQLLLLALGIWKVNGMGLLPYVLSSDHWFHSLVLTFLAGLRDRTGSRGNRNDSLWSGLTLLSNDNEDDSAVVYIEFDGGFDPRTPTLVMYFDMQTKCASSQSKNLRIDKTVSPC
jgi:hypothetical protein